jgi:hypothetical protein
MGAVSEYSKDIIRALLEAVRVPAPLAAPVRASRDDMTLAMCTGSRSAADLLRWPITHGDGELSHAARSRLTRKPHRRRPQATTSARWC